MAVGRTLAVGEGLGAADGAASPQPVAATIRLTAATKTGRRIRGERSVFMVLN